MRIEVGHDARPCADARADDAIDNNLYEPADLRAAHERNDEVQVRIYIGRRFRDDTDRLEKLFEMYTAMMKAKRVA